MGHLIMSDKEARRPGLVQAALSGKVTNAQGASALGLSVRQFRRLKAAYRKEGVPGLLHGNRGRTSPRQTSPAIRERVQDLMQTTYDGLNDSHLTEKLREVEGIPVARETVRQIRLSLLRPAVRRRRAPRHRSRRLREASEGALVLLDGSNHLWFEDRGPRATLLGAIDDATGKIVGLVFRPTEDLHGYIRLLDAVVRNHGVPLALYGDRFSAFVRNDNYWSLEDQMAGERQPTQFGRMLAELAIGFIAAHSPQAKGRIERLWETLQDRLVSEIRLRRVNDAIEANAYLPESIRDFDERFAVEARDSTRVWRAPPRHLARVLACRYQRTVAADNTVTIPGRWIQIPQGPGGRTYHRTKVEAREQLDGTLIVLAGETLLASQKTTDRDFTLLSRTTESGRRARTAAPPRDRPKTAPRKEPTYLPLGKTTSSPAAGHPWRRWVYREAAEQKP